MAEKTQKSKQKKLEDIKDLSDLMKRAELLKKHIEKNKSDKVSIRGLSLTRARIVKLTKYYKRKGILQ